MTEQRCELCGGEPHRDPDTEGWLDLYCPGVNAPQAEQDTFRSALAETFADHWEQEAKAFFAWEEFRPERNMAWDHRERSDKIAKADLPDVARPSSFALQEDATQRTDDEVARQKREEVWMPFGEFEIDVPHLTLKGPTPRGTLVTRSAGDKTEPDDALLFIDPSQDVP